MTGKTVYLITGANRGIGRAITSSLLLRPSTTVIATARDTAHETSQSLSALPTAPGSSLILIPFDANSPAPVLPPQEQDQGPLADIAQIDVVISNAGSSSGHHDDVTTVDPAALRADFEVNAVGPIRLFQAVWPLLSKKEAGAGGDSQKKFVLVTSSVGSIAGLEVEAMPGVSYGASKAAANWLAKKISVEQKELLVGIIHPGWVQTNMGQRLADRLGLPEPPMSVEDSARFVLERIDALSPETSGKYQSYDGKELPW